MSGKNHQALVFLATGALIAIGAAFFLRGNIGRDGGEAVSTPDGKAGTLAAPESKEPRITEGGAHLYAPLLAFSGITLKDVVLCPAAEANIVYPFAYSLVCSDQDCSTVLDFNGQPAPASIRVARDMQGSCVYQTIDQVASYLATYQYAGEVEITPEIRGELGITKDSAVQPTATSGFDGVTLEPKGEGLVLRLAYAGEAPEADTVFIGDKILSIRYDAPVAAPQGAQPLALAPIEHPMLKEMQKETEEAQKAAVSRAKKQ